MNPTYEIIKEFLCGLARIIKEDRDEVTTVFHSVFHFCCCIAITAYIALVTVGIISVLHYKHMRMITELTVSSCYLTFVCIMTIILLLDLKGICNYVIQLNDMHIDQLDTMQTDLEISFTEDMNAPTLMMQLRQLHKSIATHILGTSVGSYVVFKTPLDFWVGKVNGLMYGQLVYAITQTCYLVVQVLTIKGNV